MEDQKPVSVILYFNQKTKTAKPVKMVLNNEILDIKNIGLHHKVKVGDTLFHIYSVSTENLFIKLAFNTTNLHWHIEELKDKFDP